MENYTNYPKLKQIGDEGEQAFYKFMVDNDFEQITHIDDAVKITRTLSPSDWDFFGIDAYGEKATFEIKTQQECHKHDHVNVEQMQSYKPAGIATSKADYWGFVNDTLGFGFVRGEELKDIHNIICADKSVTELSYRIKNFLILKYKKSQPATYQTRKIQLWKTDYSNPAHGFKYHIDDLDWRK